MRKYVSKCYLLICLAMVSACTDQEVSTRQNALDKDEVYGLIRSRIPFYVSGAARESSSGIEDLTLDTLHDVYRNNVFFVFQTGVNFYSGNSISNDTIPTTAKAFELNTRIALPTGISYEWDDEKGTLVLKSSGTSSYFPMFGKDKTAYLDPDSFKLVSSYDPKSNATPPSMKFILKETDPKLGDVTYTFTLKPMWIYYRAPDQQVFESFVVY